MGSLTILAIVFGVSGGICMAGVPFAVAHDRKRSRSGVTTTGRVVKVEDDKDGERTFMRSSSRRARGTCMSSAPVPAATGLDRRYGFAIFRATPQRRGSTLEEACGAGRSQPSCWGSRFGLLRSC